MNKTQAIRLSRARGLLRARLFRLGMLALNATADGRLLAPASLVEVSARVRRMAGRLEALEHALAKSIPARRYRAGTQES